MRRKNYTTELYEAHHKIAYRVEGKTWLKDFTNFFHNIF